MKDLLKANGVPVRSVRAARSGMEHHLFNVVLADGTVRMGKLPRADYFDPHWPLRNPMMALAAEAQAIGLLRAKVGDFPALPDPYQLLLGDPPGALMGVVPGRAPEATLFKHGLDERALSMVCVEMGRMLAEIHRVRRPEGPTAIPDLPGHEPRAGIHWLQKLREHFPHAVWLNPEQPRDWQGNTIEAVRQVFPMYHLTVEGLTEAVKELVRRR